MVKLTDLFRKSEPDPDAVQEALVALNKLQETVLVEIEVSGHHFLSTVRLRSGAVALTCPQGLGQHLKEQGWVRVRMPHNGRKDLRLQVTQARYGGSGVMATGISRISVLCRIPGASLEEPKRGADRVRTDRFRDLMVELPSLPRPYRIVDLSTTGMKVRVQEDEAKKWFPLGSYLEHGAIQLGKRGRVQLQDLIPRHYSPDAVGLEMIVAREGNSRKLLEVFVDALLCEELKEPEAASGGAPG